MSIDLLLDPVPATERAETRDALRAVGRDDPGEVARRDQYVDGRGEIGFISSLNEPFCGACSRARLSAHGTLYTWLQRVDRYSELRRTGIAEAHRFSKVEMDRIGG